MLTLQALSVADTCDNTGFILTCDCDDRLHVFSPSFLIICSGRIALFPDKTAADHADIIDGDHRVVKPLA